MTQTLPDPQRACHALSSNVLLALMNLEVTKPSEVLPVTGYMVFVVCLLLQTAAVALWMDFPAFILRSETSNYEFHRSGIAFVFVCACVCGHFCREQNG